MVRITAYLREDSLLRTVLTMDKTFEQYHHFLMEALSHGYEINVDCHMIGLHPDSAHDYLQTNFLVDEQDFYNVHAIKNEWDFESDAPKEE